MRTICLASLAVVLAGCAGAPDYAPVNRPGIADNPPTRIDSGLEGDVIALSFSGGGARSAAFSYGVLLGLRDMRTPANERLADRISLITAVSGGAVTAAYFGLHGPDGLDGFRSVALDPDWSSELNDNWLWPLNWSRVLDGGLNNRDRLAGYLDDTVFGGRRLKDLRNSPLVLINATELYTGAPFAFASPWFNAICSDAASVLVADAVAASMAVPLGFRPTILASYAGTCARPVAEWVASAAGDRSAPIVVRETARAFESYRDPREITFLHLADGGVVDNFGLASLATLRRAIGDPPAPFSARDAVRMRSLTFIVVNAEMTSMADWARSPKGPDGAQMLGVALENSIKATKRNALDAFAGQLDDWREDIVAWRCGLAPAEAYVLGANGPWVCDDLHFRLDTVSFRDLGEADNNRLGSLPTAVSLPSEDIDALIAGGMRAARENPALSRLTVPLP